MNIAKLQRRVIKNKSGKIKTRITVAKGIMTRSPLVITDSLNPSGIPQFFGNFEYIIIEITKTGIAMRRPKNENITISIIVRINRTKYKSFMSLLAFM